MKHRLMSGVAATLLAAALVAPAAAASQCDAAVPQQHQLVGKTRLSVLFWDVYDARLFTDSGQFEWSRKASLNKVLVLDYLRDIKAKDLVETTGEEWQRLKFDHADQQQWLEQLQAMWPDINEGDCLALVETKEGYAEFYQGEKLLGTIKDKTFTEYFLAIWLSPESRFDDEREELVGESS